jgi:predicted RecA/RadA family phage recombinase
VAKNVIFETSDTESVTVTDPATPVSGDPVLFGDLPGLAAGATTTIRVRIGY